MHTPVTDDRPDEAQNDPAGHAVHELAPDIENVAEGQSKQLAEVNAPTDEEYLPLSQLVHVEESPYWPEGQD